jgi:hypothetical protein
MLPVDPAKAKADFLRKITTKRRRPKAVEKRYIGISETAIVGAIKAALELEPGMVIARNNTGRLRDTHGRPVKFGLGRGSADLIGCLDGRYFAIEVKTQTGETTKWQEAWLQSIRDVGGFACVVRSVDEARSAVARCRLENEARKCG